MWLDTFLMNQPSKCLGIAISAITDEAFWVYTKLLLDTINHIQCGIDFRLSDRRCCFNINNHSIIQVHQIVGGIGKDRIGLLCSSKACCRINRREHLWFHGRCSAESGIIKGLKVFFCRPCDPFWRPI